MTKLAEFILEYIDHHKLSRRALAEKMGVQHRTLNNYINNGDSHPTLYFLTMLCRATGTDLLTLVALVAPDDVKPINPDIMRLAERINNLPGAYKEAVIAMIMNAPLKGGNDG